MAIDNMENNIGKHARMATMVSHPDGSPPTGGVDYGRKNDLFCTSYCWIVPRCANKAASYSNSISGSILPLSLPNLSLVYPNLDKTRLLDKPVTSLLKESHFL